AALTAVTTGGRLAGLAGNQAQAVAALALGRSGASGSALGGVQLTGTGGQATVFTPCGVLGGDLGDGLALRAALDLLLVGQAQELAALQHVDVVIDEGVRIEVLDRQHRLVYGAATAYTLGDFPQRVAASGGVFVAIDGAGGGRLARSRTGSRCSGRCSATRRCGGSYRRLRGRGGLGRIQRRIQQQGVLAQQTAVRPQ